MANSQITDLKEKLAAISDVNAARSLLSWDQQTYMPPKAAAARGSQLSTLSAISHRMSTSKELGKLLNSLNDDRGNLETDEWLLVRETLRDYEKSTKLPEDFVQEMSETTSAAFQAWMKARQDSDFNTFQPFLEKIITLNIRKAEYLGFEETPYDALLDLYEPDMTTKQVTEIFDELAPKQSALVEKIVNSPHQPDTSWLDQDWDEDAQVAFTKRVIAELNFDLEAGRQDFAAHPFCTSFDLYDVRLTTRVSKSDLFSCLMASIHECGHGLYEQGFLPNDRKTTLGHAISLGVHESQSRMWENMIGRSLPFWKHYAEPFKKMFPGKMDALDAEKIHGAINRVERSFIRVEADECTYNLHVIMRYEIERDMLEGKLAAKDVPEAWNAKIKEYLGLDVPNDTLGCLQDVHWSYGSMGYFPTYSLGNLYAAQMFEKIEADLPDLWDDIGQGNFLPLLTWLRANVHEVGRRRKAIELVQDITGSEPSCDAYLNYLQKKYGALYQV